MVLMGESEAGEGHGGHNKEEGRHQIALGFARDYQQDRIYRISPQRSVPRSDPGAVHRSNPLPALHAGRRPVDFNRLLDSS